MNVSNIISIVNIDIVLEELSFYIIQDLKDCINELI